MHPLRCGDTRRRRSGAPPGGNSRGIHYGVQREEGHQKASATSSSTLCTHFDRTSSSRHDNTGCRGTRPQPRTRPPSSQRQAPKTLRGRWAAGVGRGKSRTGSFFSQPFFLGCRHRCKRERPRVQNFMDLSLSTYIDTVLVDSVESFHIFSSSPTELTKSHFLKKKTHTRIFTHLLSSRWRPET